ncbi:uncharacterized protein LOC111106332 isoform X2 [Crassostrea virginica]
MFQKTDRKYVVSESKLMELFSICPTCSFSTLCQIKKVLGTMIKIDLSCGMCGFQRTWDSQEMIGAIPSGNMSLFAAILFSGLIPSKGLRFLDHMNVAAIALSTFHQHQKYYLHPAVSTLWKEFQNNYFDQKTKQGDGLVLGGDGRADTPGHSAKYGSYAMLDMDLMLVIDIQLVQSNEVRGSFHMEKEGFIRSVDFIESKGLKIEKLVTDRHLQIQKHVRENMPNTTHNYDVWHVAKGFKKKVTAMSKLKDCESLQPWIKSLCNHLYWVPASTPSGHGQLMLEKWQSVCNHVQNIHEHDGDIFQSCEHGPLDEQERRKKWLEKGSKASVKLEELVMSKQMQKDIPKLSPGVQTASLEGFHSVINQFAPKMFGFSYQGMLSRLRLAALHYNENGMREQAFTKDGQPQYNIIYPKFKKGGYTVREVKIGCTFGYVSKLMDIVFSNARESKISQVEVERMEAPPPLCSSFEKPDKASAILEMKSRYRQAENVDEMNDDGCC